LDSMTGSRATKGKKTTALSCKILHRDVDGEHIKTEWEYDHIIGQPNLLEKSTSLTLHMQLINALDSLLTLRHRTSRQ